MKLVVALTIALILIPLISWLSSKLKSLPIQFICSSVSITVLSLEVFSQLTENTNSTEGIGIGQDAVYALFFGIVTIVVASTITVVSFLVHDKDTTEQKKWVQDGAYVFSLFASCFSIIFAYLFVSQAEIIFSKKFDNGRALADFFTLVFSDRNDFNFLLFVTIVIFLLAIVYRIIKDRLFLSPKTERNG